MTIKIRKSFFETNSSSTHSITIVNSGKRRQDAFGGGKGPITIEQGEFGWEEMTYRDADTKASYCLTYAGEDKHLRKMLKDVIEKETGRSVVFASYKGYIDHQSCDVPKEAFESEENLRNFIFNPDSVLVTDNDNH